MSSTPEVRYPELMKNLEAQYVQEDFYRVLAGRFVLNPKPKPQSLKTCNLTATAITKWQAAEEELLCTKLLEAILFVGSVLVFVP